MIPEAAHRGLPELGSSTHLGALDVSLPNSYSVFPTLSLCGVNCCVSENKKREKETSAMLTSRGRGNLFPTKEKAQRVEAGGLGTALPHY